MRHQVRRAFGFVFIVWGVIGIAIAQVPGFIGSFNVGDGPVWTSNPPTYTCLEACALLFGGTSTDYQCSTDSGLIDNQAFVDGWGDTQYCNAPVAEDFKLNDPYDCGSSGCSYSAYVSDHPECGSSTNYCFASGATGDTTPVPVMSRTWVVAMSLGMLVMGALMLRRRRHG